MPPLTLEQVLARSMRLPNQRAQKHVSQLYRGSSGSGGGVGVMAASHASRTTALTEELTEPGLFQPSRSDATTPRGRRSKFASLRAPARQEKLNFFALMDREDAARRAGRLSIHRSDHLVRNSADLTTFLTAAGRTGDWQDGLKAFAEATALPGFQRLLDEHAIEPTTNTATTTPSAKAKTLRSDAATIAGASTSFAGSSVSLTGVNPNLDHVLALLNMCAAAHQYALAEAIGTFFAPAFPEAFVRLVELLAARGGEGEGEAASSDAEQLRGWQAAFVYLTARCPLPAAEVPVEAFNVCLRGCEAARDWRGALRVVRAMGPNPIQGWTAAGEKEEEEEGVDGSMKNRKNPAESSTGAAAEGSESSKSPLDASALPGAGAAVDPVLSTPPPPNVVSYATLIATLEQAGKDQIASAVLNRLPAVEKEEITASYAALIFVWSNQVLHKHRRRF